MTRSRAKFTWYSGVAFLVALLLAGGPDTSVASDTIARQDTAPQTESSSSAIRLHVGDDVLRRIDRTWFAPTEPHYFTLFHTLVELAPASPTLQPAGSVVVSAQARAPPTHR